jgi:hypothetical protein
MSAGRYVPLETSRLLRKPFLVGGRLLMRVTRMVQRDGTIHPLCSRRRIVERFDYTLEKQAKIVVVQT